MSELGNTMQMLAGDAKRLGDRALGWQYEEVRRLTLRADAPEGEAVSAEVHHEPASGLERTVVRLLLPAGWGGVGDLLDQLPTGVSLYEGGHLLGPAQSWRVQRCSADRSTEEITDVWLESPEP